MIYKTYHFFLENKKLLIPVLTQISLFIARVIIDISQPLSLLGSIQADNMIFLSTLIASFIIMIIGFNKAIYWFYGSVLYYMLTIVGVHFNWFPIRVRRGFMGGYDAAVLSLYTEPFIVFTIQGLLLCVVKFLKWII